MAKQRYINTRFWSDSFVSELNALDRYLFLYFLTNEHTNIAGIYELPLRTISFETGIELEMLTKMLKRLAGKVYYIDGWVYIKNFQKHQSSSSRTVQKGIEIEMEKIPLEIKKKAEELYGIDTAGIPYIYPTIYSNSNSNLNSNSNKSSEASSLAPVKREKKKYGEFENVLLLDEELEKLHSKLGEKNTNIIIEELSSYVASKGKRYSSHYATLLGWARRKVEHHVEKESTKRRIV